MNEAVPETYILPVAGSDATQEVPRSVVLERIAKGEIKPTDWIWSPPDQDWKTVAEIPSLQAAAPAAKKSLLSALSPLPPPKKTEPITAPPPGLPPAPKKKKVKPKRTTPEEKDEPSRFGTFLYALILLLFVIVAANYQFVDRPFDGALAETKYVLVPAHAHLGAFIQRDTLIIHVLPTSELTPDNFADFLVTLAGSTPPAPFGAPAFNTIELTPAWRGKYAFIGDDWRKLAQMASSSPEEIKNFVLDHVDDATGQKLLPPVRPDVLPDQAARDQVWETMTGSFHAEGNPSGPNLVTSLVSKVSSVIPHGNGAAPGSAKPGPTNAAPPH